MSDTRAQQIADQLRSAIQRGDYVAGERLVELALSQTLRVSQNTIREALRILEQEGWVVRSARRGTHVRSFTPEETAELYALWATVSELALGWALERLTRSDLKRLRRLVNDARQRAQTGDGRSMVEALFAFHRALAELAQKPQTAELLRRLRHQAWLLEQVRAMQAPRTWQEHEALAAALDAVLTALEHGEMEAAQRTLHHLIMADCAALLAVVEAGS